MTPYQTVPLNIVTGDYKSRSPSWSSMSLVNLYMDVQQLGRTPACVIPWPGEKEFANTGLDGQACRGMIELNEVVYVLIGTSLFEISENNLAINVGTIPGSDYTYIFTDGLKVFFRISGTGAYINKKVILQGNGLTYVYDPESDGNRVRIVTVPEMPDDAFRISDAGNTETFRISQFRTAELDSDPLQQVYVFQQKIIMLGTRSLQFFQDSTDDIPIVPVLQASTTSVGAASRFSAANTPNYFYFLGNDRVVYRIASYRTEPVSNSAITNELEKVDVSDAIGFTVQLQGQWFYILQLPAADATLAFSELTGEWLRLSTGTEPGFSRHMISGAVFARGKNIIAGENDGKIYEWDYDTFTSNGDPIIRQFQTAPVNSASLGRPGRRLFANRVALVMETGGGNLNEPAPQLMFSHSIDGGRSFIDEDWIEYGREGQSGLLVEYYMRDSFYDLSLRIRLSDPNFIGIHAASIDLKDGGI